MKHENLFTADYFSLTLNREMLVRKEMRELPEGKGLTDLL